MPDFNFVPFGAKFRGNTEVSRNQELFDSKDDNLIEDSFDIHYQENKLKNSFKSSKL